MRKVGGVILPLDEAYTTKRLLRVESLERQDCSDKYTGLLER
jgi:hypothetical protein